MDQRYVCKSCFHVQLDTDGCSECGEQQLVELEEVGEHEPLVQQLEERVASRRRKFILGMEAMAILFCAGVLFVALTVARGLGGGVLDWAAKLFAIALLALFWKAIPTIYGQYLLDAPSRLLLRVQGEGEG